MNIYKSKDTEIFQIDKLKKNKFFLEEINSLTKFHYENSNKYRKFINLLYDRFFYSKKIYDIPYLPVRIFKELDIYSVPKQEIIKIMSSSGTGNAGVSKIFLDKETSKNQVIALSKIASNFIGSKRKPMIIVDSKSIISNTNNFSARTTGVLGFSIFGKNIEFMLNDDLSLNIDLINEFIKKNNDQEKIMFGFTYIIWEKLISALEKANLNLNFSNTTMIHGGGWKKIKSQSISEEQFKKTINKRLSIRKVINYYGMVEQTGSIFMECEKGYLHTSIYSDILIRDKFNFQVIHEGKEGLVQLLSILPKSYPGHSILTEDIGIIYGEDNCACGKKGKIFKIAKKRIEKYPWQK